MIMRIVILDILSILHSTDSTKYPRPNLALIYPGLLADILLEPV